tara:strand:+ start:3257 stop:4444 length:1188 start_codon:yes stop_codon:yes gene_type:complete
MASWKKVIVSGSSARLSSLGVNVDAPSTAGEISASGKIHAVTATSTGLSTYNVVIKDGSTGEFKMTSSLAISPSNSTLLIPSNGGLTGTSYDGSSEVTITVDSSSLAGNGLTPGAAGTPGFDVGQGENIIVGDDAVHVNSGSLVDNTKGLSADVADITGLTANKIGVNLGTGLSFNAGAIDAAFVNGAALTDGDGILNFSYNGGGAVSIGVDSASIAGTGLESTSVEGKISLDGHASLVTNRITKWDGSKLVSSGITDTGTLITLGDSNDTVTIPGNLTVIGTASFQNSTDVSIADPFFLMASGSTSDTAFGIVGQTGSGALDGIGWVYNPTALGSSSPRFTMVTGSNVVNGGTVGVAAGAASLLVASTDIGEDDEYMAAEGNMLVNSGDIYLYF